MEKLIISNFLNLQDMELDLGKINIIIGPQAQGKSVLAKLVFFFKNFWVNYRNSIIAEVTKREFDRQLIQEFKEIFPYYSWNNQDFKIIYQDNEYEIILKNSQLDSGRFKLVLDYPQSLSKTRNKLIRKLKKTKEQPIRQIDFFEYSWRDFNVSEELLKELFPSPSFNAPQYESIKDPFFIPAGRSFFAIVEENIFSFLSSKIELDYFLKEFGSYYELCKKNYKESSPKQGSLYNLISTIISGKYVRENDQDWIYCNPDQRKIHVSNASSGQQEALPMILILAIFPFIEPSSLFNKFFLIEEPEAHLFPKSQKHIIELISLVFNLTKKNHGFFITTHSPYILTAFNNLIQAGNTLKAINQRADKEEQRKKLFKIVSENLTLDINDFRVYTLENGKLESIIDRENQLIDANIIDGVSEEISETFEKLVELEIELQSEE
jgi:AAA15 family ATPase/GTPase